MTPTAAVASAVVAAAVADSAVCSAVAAAFRSNSIACSAHKTRFFVFSIKYDSAFAAGIVYLPYLNVHGAQCLCVWSNVFGTHEIHGL